MSGGQIFLDQPMPIFDVPGSYFVQSLPPAHRETVQQARDREIEDAMDVILWRAEGLTDAQIRDQMTAARPTHDEKGQPWRVNEHDLGRRLHSEVDEAFEVAARLMLYSGLGVAEQAAAIRRSRPEVTPEPAPQQARSTSRSAPPHRMTPKALRREARRERNAATRMTMEAQSLARHRPAPAAPAPSQQVKLADLDPRAVRELQTSMSMQAWEVGRRLGLEDPPIVLVADIDTETDALAHYNATQGTISIAANLVGGGATTWDGVPLVGAGLAAFVSDTIVHEVAHAGQGDVSDPHGPDFVRAIARLSAIAPMPDRLTRAEFWPFISRPDGYYGRAHSAVAMQRAVDAL